MTTNRTLPLLGLLALTAACNSGSAKIGETLCGDTGLPCTGSTDWTRPGTATATGTGTGSGTGSGTGMATGTGTGTATGTATGTGTGTGSGTTTQGVDTWVGTNDTGTGPGGLLYQVQVTVESSRDPNGGPGSWVYQTDMEAVILDVAGLPVSGVSAHLDTDTLGSTQLIEDPGTPGLYTASVVGYARTYTLDLNPGDPVEAFSAELVGPEPHDFVGLAPAPWDVSVPLVVDWAPFGADAAEASSNGSGGLPIDDDGHFEIPALALDYTLGEADEEELALRRWNRLDLDGALPGSWLEVSLEIATNPTDTTDTRRTTLDGTITLPNAYYYYYNGPYDYGYAEVQGDVHVLLWPDAVDPEVTPYWHHTTIPDGSFTTDGPYSLPSIEPGDWQLVAYVDTNGSDVGLPQPAGPSLGEPSNLVGFTADGVTPTVRNVFLWDAWSGF